MHACAPPPVHTRASWRPKPCTVPPARPTYKPPPTPPTLRDLSKNEPVNVGAVNGQEFVKDLRKLQARTKCTSKTLVDFIRLFGKYVGEEGAVPKGFQTCDKKLKKAAGVELLELHGCTACHRHVFLPSSKATHCPRCGGARYDAQGKPNEVSYIIYIYV